jgi:hypothetical protein
MEVPADTLTPTTWETLTQNHAAKLFTDS